MKKYKNNTKMFKICLLLIGIVTVFSFGINATSAASSPTIYVSTHGDDSWNGLNSTHVSGTNGPKASVTNATGTVQSNGEVHIASGTYNESGIEITKNMKIIGNNQHNTIINGQNSLNSIFTIDSGVKVTLVNLTFMNTKASAIKNNGILKIINCTFINNNAVNGGAINNPGTLDISECTFTNNTSSVSDMTSGGGAIYNSGNLTIKTSNFTNNTSSGSGHGLGGAICNVGNLTIDSSTFTSNGRNGWIGGVIYTSGNSTITNSKFYNNTCWIAGVIFNENTGLCEITGSDFDGNSAMAYGGAIENDGTLIVNHSNFTNNVDTFYGGGAIANLNSATINNCKFINNHANTAYYGGGAFMNFGDNGIINNCTFINNTASNGGAVYTSGYTLILSNSTITGNNATNGGAVYTSGYTLILTNSTITGNNATNGGAVYTSGHILNLTNSTITGNNATNGGAIYNDGSMDTIQFNRIMGNTGSYQIYNLNANSGTIDARYNWWGSNADPSTEIFGTGVNYTPWIVLTVTANPAAINKGDNSKITADLLHDSNGTYHNPVNGLVPDGLKVNFSSDSNGTLTPISAVTTNGQANTTFTGINIAVSTVSATIDKQTVTTDVTINKLITKIHVEPVSGLKGDNVNLTAKLTDNHNNPVKDAQIQFSINGTVVGTAKTNTNGIATLKYTITQNNGTYSIFTEYLGNNTNIGSNDTNQLTVRTTPVNPVYTLYMQITSSNSHPKIGETFTLTYKLGNYGPDNANNITVIIPIPAGFSVTNITGDGNWIYNTTKRTIIWTLTNVAVGDPYLYITGKITNAGQYIFSSSISTETLKLNSANIVPTNTTKTTQKTASNTIPMQHTGMPIAGLILAILSIVGGSIISRKK